MSKYSKGDHVSYKGSNAHVGKTHGNSNSGMGKLSNSGEGKITSVQNHTVRVSNSDGSSTTVSKSRID